MKQIPELIVMLTRNDQTIWEAERLYEEARLSKALYWGMKEEPLPLIQLQRIFDRMKSDGKKTCLEVVTYTEQESLEGAKIAVACHCDLLMGTKYSPAVRDLLAEHGIAYHPFVGKVSMRPSILEGSLSEMVEEAKECLRAGCAGIDLLGYRYRGDAARLNEEFVKAVPGPVCLAGSIGSFERLKEVKKTNPDSFTIGSAFFTHAFGGSLREQIDAVWDFMHNDEGE